MVLRIQKAQRLLSELKVDLLIIEDPIDLYYLTGFHLSEGRLVIEEKQATLFVDGRYFEACQAIDFLNVKLTAGYGHDSTFGKEILPRHGKEVGFDALKTTYQSYELLSEICKDKFHLVPLRAPLKKVRQIKEEGELALLREAGRLGSLGFDYVVRLLKEGLQELEVAAELEIFWRKNGGEKVSFDPIIAFGKNSAFPHYRAGEARLKKNEPILIDIGVQKAHYASDMTRVVVLGELSKEIEKIYDVVKAAQKAAIDLCRPGVKIQELDDAARGLIVEAGFGNYFTHGLGHGVGLEVHELPIIRGGSYGEIELEAGMVITIEPGIYLPGKGGVRLEDTIAITKNGCENFTNRPCVPSSVANIKALH